jgi:LAO/AO transport system kinase
MEDVGDHENMFIRSLASRGAHNGLADNVPEILLTMDAHGFDEVILETVGIGQVECAVRDLVDTTVLVLNPESGDRVQAMKAGVLEAADIILVNKSDLPGAEKIATEVTSVIKLRRHSPHDWPVRVLTTSRADEAGLKALDDALSEHAAWARTHRDPNATRRARRAYHLMTLLVRSGADIIARLPAESVDAPLHESFAQLIESLKADLPRQGNGK